MTKNGFRKRMIVSSLLTALSIGLVLSFCVIIFIQYAKPDEHNTSVSSGTVADVYHGGKKKGIMVGMSNGDQLQLVYPFFSGELYSEIGYDLDGLCELLKGEEIAYRRMDRLPWIVEIYADDIVIDNNVLTVKQTNASRITLVMVGLITLALLICGDAAYIKKQYRCFKNSEKKRERKERQSLRKNHK